MNSYENIVNSLLKKLINEDIDPNFSILKPSKIKKKYYEAELEVLLLVQRYSDEEGMEIKDLIAKPEGTGLSDEEFAIEYYRKRNFIYPNYNNKDIFKDKKNLLNMFGKKEEGAKIKKIKVLGRTGRRPYRT